LTVGIQQRDCPFPWRFGIFNSPQRLGKLLQNFLVAWMKGGRTTIAEFQFWKTVSSDDHATLSTGVFLSHKVSPLTVFPTSGKRFRVPPGDNNLRRLSVILRRLATVSKRAWASSRVASEASSPRTSDNATSWAR
jgi:hypothetical protein